MNWYNRLGLTSKLIFPLLIIFPVIILFQVSQIRVKSKESAVEIAKDSAMSTIEQFKILRGYYTKNIVQKVKASGAAIKFHYDHKEVNGVLPLPATVIYDLSKELSHSKSGVKLNLYSDKPFPNRKDRKLDEFQEKAITRLKKDSNTTYIEENLASDTPYVRVAIADKLVAQGCVNCHNAHPQTPFRGWRLNDVRGVLEARVPIKKSIEAGTSLATTVGWTVFLSGVFIVCVVIFILSQFIVSPVRNLTLKLKKNANESMERFSSIEKSTQQILDATEVEISNIQGTTSALDEITAMVQQSTDQAKKSGEKANHSSQVALEGKKAIESVSVSMGEIAQSTKDIESNVADGNDKLRNIISIIEEIGQKTAVINDIVFQTKLLSFNASVEAARAGEHGKGFAVVAEEVGNLAKMSGDSASEINTMLQNSKNEVENAIQEINSSVQGAVNNTISVVERGSKSVANCEKTLIEIVENVNEVKLHMTEIVCAASEQQSGVDDISCSVHSINESSREIAEASKVANINAAEIVEHARSILSVATSLEYQVMGYNKKQNFEDEIDVESSDKEDSVFKIVS